MNTVTATVTILFSVSSAFALQIGSLYSGQNVNSPTGADTAFPNVFQGKAYGLGPSQLNYGDAAKACSKQGGRLAVVRSADVLAYLLSILKASGSGAVNTWIGATRIGPGKDDFIWSDGGLFVKTNFTAWGQLQPDFTTGSEYCVHLDGQGLWNDNGCQKTMGYICEKVGGGSSGSQSSGNFSCPVNWVASGRSCYFLGQDFSDLTWYEANAFCDSFGMNAHLSETNDADEWYRVQALVKTGNYTRGPWLASVRTGTPEKKNQAWFNTFSVGKTLDAKYNKWMDDLVVSSTPATKRCLAFTYAGGWDFFDCRTPPGSPLCEIDM